MHNFEGVSLVLVILGLMGECSKRDTYDVLALLPLVSPSNHQYDEAVLMALARRGHRVTVYSQFPPVRPHPRYRHVRLDGHPKPDYYYFQKRWALWRKSDYATFRTLNVNRFYKTVAYARNSLQLRPLRENLKAGKEHYDVVVTEHLTGQEHLLLFAHWMKAPVVVLEPFSWNITTDVQYVFEPISTLFDLTSFIGKLYRAIYSFIGKLYRAIYPFYDLELHYIIYLKIVNGMLQSYYRDSPLVWDLVKTTPILTFTNDMAVKSVTYPTVRVSGIHIKSSSPQLSQHLLQFLDSADGGVIVIEIRDLNLGRFPPHPYFQALWFLVQSLPGRVLWSGASKLTNFSGNVQSMEMIPQQVLVHTNCKLLITDGDLLTIQKAFYFGVPVLVVPRTTFQHYTAAYIKAAGMGEVMELEEFFNHSTQLLKIQEMLRNKRYKERADNVSREFRYKMRDLEWTVHHSLVEAVSGYRPSSTDTPHQPRINFRGYLTRFYLFWSHLIHFMVYIFFRVVFSM